MPERRRHALAMLAAIDDGVGRVKETLRKYSIEENTIIFFISDNGAPLKITKEDKPIPHVAGCWDGSLTPVSKLGAPSRTGGTREWKKRP